MAKDQTGFETYLANKGGKDGYSRTSLKPTGTFIYAHADDAAGKTSKRLKRSLAFKVA